MQGGPTVRRVDLQANTPRRRTLLESLFQREPTQHETLAVRAGGNVSDAVVLQSNQGVHWAPALNRVLEGRYCFRLSHLPVGTTGVVRTFTLDWDRTRDRESIAPVPNLTPGAYAMEKGTPDTSGTCRIDPDEMVAWIAVVPEADFARVSAEWKDNSSWFDQLERSGESLSVVLAVRHAVLASLADSIEKR